MPEVNSELALVELRAVEQEDSLQDFRDTSFALPAQVLDVADQHDEQGVGIQPPVVVLVEFVLVEIGLEDEGDGAKDRHEGEPSVDEVGGEQTQVVEGGVEVGGLNGNINAKDPRVVNFSVEPKTVVFRDVVLGDRDFCVELELDDGDFCCIDRLAIHDPR